MHCHYYQYNMILRLKINIHVRVFSYSETKIDIEAECQMLFRWTKSEKLYVYETRNITLFFDTCVKYFMYILNNYITLNVKADKQILGKMDISSYNFRKTW